MPNEKINDHVSQGWYTEVSWRRKPGLDPDDQGRASGHVQLATVNALSPFHFPDIDTGDHFEAGEKFDGWRVTLDEAGIDRLIKTLHKAKGQAFGETRAQQADRVVTRYQQMLTEGEDVTTARHAAWASLGYSVEDIAQLDQMVGAFDDTQAAMERKAYPQRIVLGSPPQYAPGGFTQEEAIAALDAHRAEQAS
jgi:hypothetical protein